MKTKTSKPKAVSSNGTARTNGKPANGVAPKTDKQQKSMYEEWIEKYGVSSSRADRLMQKTMKRIQEANRKSEA